VSVESVRAVVLAYGTGEEYVPLLETLDREGLAPEQVLLVHNPSVPGERLPSAPAGCELLSATYNRGYAAGMNLGIRRQLEREPELLLVLTHDARLRPEALRRMLETARQSPRYGVLGPALVLTGSETPFSFGGLSDARGGLSHRKVEPDVAGGVAGCDWVDGGTMLIRAEALEAVGDFDERLWSYCEDADLCLRVARGGFQVGVVLAAQADQAPGASKRLGSWAYLMTRNGIAYAQRFAGLRGVLAVTRRELTGAVVELIRSGARIARLRSGPPGETWAVAVGTLRGALAYYSRRWGPPPANLPGAGDIQNVTPPSHADVR
jgi:GT2 family glycosyltransferase